MTLADFSLSYIDDATGFQLIEVEDKEFLVYTKESNGSDLIIMDLNTTAIQWYKGVKQYRVSESGKSVLAEIETSNTEVHNLVWIDIPSFKQTIIHHGLGVQDIFINSDDRQGCFVVDDIIGKSPIRSLWMYYKGRDSADEILDGSANKLGTGYNIGEIEGIKHNGKDIFFTIRKCQNNVENAEDANRIYSLELSGFHFCNPNKIRILGTIEII